MTTIFFNQYGIFILFLFCIGATSVEMILYKKLFKPLLERLSNFQLKLQTKLGKENIWSVLLDEYNTCPVCHATITIITVGILTGILKTDFNYTIISFIFSTPLALLIKKIF